MLTQKPRDKDGVTIPHDHEEISNDNFVIRGIPKHHIINGRISSGAFKSSSDPYKGMSIDLAQIDGSRDYSSEAYLGAVKFQAKIPRGVEQEETEALKVGYDPLTENSAHGQIWRYNDDMPQNITTGQARNMQRNCTWHTEIKDVTITK